MEKEWLDNLKVGDRVVILGSQDYLSKVERFTKTLIITEGGRKFRKDGASPGSGWDRGILVEPTPERVNTIRHDHLANHLRNFSNWKRLSLETLRGIYKLTKEGS